MCSSWQKSLTGPRWYWDGFYRVSKWLPPQRSIRGELWQPCWEMAFLWPSYVSAVETTQKPGTVMVPPFFFFFVMVPWVRTCFVHSEAVLLPSRSAKVAGQEIKHDCIRNRSVYKQNGIWCLKVCVLFCFVFLTAKLSSGRHQTLPMTREREN